VQDEEDYLCETASGWFSQRASLLKRLKNSN